MWIHLTLTMTIRKEHALCLFPISPRDQASNWLERPSADAIPQWKILLPVSLLNLSTMKDKQNSAINPDVSNNIMVISLSEACLVSESLLLRKVPSTWQCDLGSKSNILTTLYVPHRSNPEKNRWNDPVISKEESLDYENPDLEQLLGVMECKEERVKQLEEYMEVIMGDFMQLSLEVTRGLKEKIIEEGSRMRKIEKITRYLEKKYPKPYSNLKFSKTLTKSTSFYAPDFIPQKSLCVKYVRTIFPSLPLVKESTFGFKPGTNNNQNIKSRYDVENPSPQSTPHVHLSFEENTPPVTYPDEVEDIIEISIEVVPLDETPLEDLRLNTCNNNIPLSSKEFPSFDGLEPQPLLN
ncbi:hypothetical protein Tco_0184023 [Tanacetum coccineum]